MSKYHNGKIYTIRCRTNDNLIYVGSTIEKRLSARFNKHKCQYCCSLYKFINNSDNNTNWNDWYIELYEEYSCSNKMELVKRENEIIRLIGTINKIGYRTEEMKKQKDKEYRDKNKETIAKKNKVYRENNLELMKENKKKYYYNNRENILQKSKIYNQINKEKNNNYTKEYVKKNRDYIYQKIQCKCGSLISRKGIREHERTKVHNEKLKKAGYLS